MFAASKMFGMFYTDPSRTRIVECSNTVQNDAHSMNRSKLIFEFDDFKRKSLVFFIYILFAFSVIIS